MYSVGVDIGGMSIKVGIVDSNGKIISKSVFETTSNAYSCIDKLGETINLLIDNQGLQLSDIKGIGIGCPGSVQKENGFIEILPNLGWEGVSIVELLKNKINLPIEIANDASAAVLGEFVYGQAKGLNDVIMFTLGTGVGGGMILNGKLYEGASSKGGELGHVTLHVDGYECTCGRKGCVETYVSATALIKETKRAMLNDKSSKLWSCCEGDIDRVNGKTAFDCENIDQTAKSLVETYIKHLSESVLNMLNIFRPQMVVIGGGIGKQGKNLTDRVVEYCEKYHYGYPGALVPKIVPASLGNDAGIIGAAALLNV